MSVYPKPSNIGDRYHDSDVLTGAEQYVGTSTDTTIDHSIYLKTTGGAVSGVLTASAGIHYSDGLQTNAFKSEYNDDIAASKNITDKISIISDNDLLFAGEVTCDKALVNKNGECLRMTGTNATIAAYDSATSDQWWYIGNVVSANPHKLYIKSSRPNGQIHLTCGYDSSTNTYQPIIADSLGIYFWRAGKSIGKIGGSRSGVANDDGSMYIENIWSNDIIIDSKNGDLRIAAGNGDFILENNKGITFESTGQPNSYQSQAFTDSHANIISNISNPVGSELTMTGALNVPLLRVTNDGECIRLQGSSCSIAAYTDDGTHYFVGAKSSSPDELLIKNFHSTGGSIRLVTGYTGAIYQPIIADGGGVTLQRDGAVVGQIGPLNPSNNTFCVTSTADDLVIDTGAYDVRFAASGGNVVLENAKQLVFEKTGSFPTVQSQAFTDAHADTLAALSVSGSDLMVAGDISAATLTVNGVQQQSIAASGKSVVDAVAPLVASGNDLSLLGTLTLGGVAGEALKLKSTNSTINWYDDSDAHQFSIGSSAGSDRLLIENKTAGGKITLECAPSEPITMVSRGQTFWRSGTYIGAIAGSVAGDEHFHVRSSSSAENSLKLYSPRGVLALEARDGIELNSDMTIAAGKKIVLADGSELTSTGLNVYATMKTDMIVEPGVKMRFEDTNAGEPDQILDFDQVLAINTIVAASRPIIRTISLSLTDLLNVASIPPGGGFTSVHSFNIGAALYALGMTSDFDSSGAWKSYRIFEFTYTAKLASRGSTIHQYQTGFRNIKTSDGSEHTSTAETIDAGMECSNASSMWNTQRINHSLIVDLTQYNYELYGQYKLFLKSHLDIQAASSVSISLNGFLTVKATH